LIEAGKHIDKDGIKCFVVGTSTADQGKLYSAIQIISFTKSYFSLVSKI